MVGFRVPVWFFGHRVVQETAVKRHVRTIVGHFTQHAGIRTVLKTENVRYEKKPRAINIENRAKFDEIKLKKCHYTNEHILVQSIICIIESFPA